LDELLPVATSQAWADRGVPVEVVTGAGHLLEWDEPDGVAGRLVEFLASVR
jgi:pimeloyl-ACP methyl ester carboxylesterase